MTLTGSHIVLKSGALRIAIAAASIRQIVPSDGITRVPMTKPEVAGVLTRDGRAIPVYEVTALTHREHGKHFGGERVPEDERRQIVIVERDGMLAGFLVAGTESSGSAQAIDGDSLLDASGIFDAGKGGDHAAMAAEGDS